MHAEGVDYTLLFLAIAACTNPPRPQQQPHLAYKHRIFNNQQVTAAVPSYGVGAKSALKKPAAKPAAAAAAAAAPAVAAAATWKLAADDDDEDELVDEEELLTEEDKVRPAPKGGRLGLRFRAWLCFCNWVHERQVVKNNFLPRPQPLLRRPHQLAADDCEVGAAGRKACKDCTCGRAEAEAAGVKVQLTPEMMENPGAGSCGNVSGVLGVG